MTAYTLAKASSSLTDSNGGTAIQLLQILDDISTNGEFKHFTTLDYCNFRSEYKYFMTLDNFNFRSQYKYFTTLDYCNFRSEYKHKSFDV